MELNAANVARHKISEKLNDVEFLDSPKKIRSCLRSVASRSAVDFTGNRLALRIILRYTNGRKGFINY